ncbi:dipeptide/oligopeptide/nickel ABC transporter ATP-binding protein [Serinicoccus chungangensis]|uniref:Dipeptide/oligopeptide/nickel ABC transporter ATP-binding protein n=1 Tax=Serinicoccus chungangensis TaxID=767452 RepID=A0A0W8I1U9_9MICO|nr:dipeptide/oligopeptide/nickel ABC transporter ATP-binding protein [Serinicoccus chungangensis]
MPALDFRDVTVTYGTGTQTLRAVDDVTLQVPAGSVVGLVGESGSGKSTLARAAIGMAPVTAGSITASGRPLPRRGRRPVQMVFQDPVAALDPRMSVRASLTEALGVAGAVPRREREAEVARLLELVHLDPGLAGRMPAALSGGQRQRVSVARAIAARPEVIIADEITSALDVSVQGAMLNLIRELRAELNLSMLFISHNLAVVRYVCDIVAVMYLGRIVEVGPTAELVADPQHPYTRLLLSTAPRVGTSLAASTLPPQVQDTEPADPHAPPTGCRFHPRCPRGPMVLPGRQQCVDEDPSDGSGDRPHRAACWFPGERVDLPSPRPRDPQTVEAP